MRASLQDSVTAIVESRSFDNGRTDRASLQDSVTAIVESRSFDNGRTDRASLQDSVTAIVESRLFDNGRTSRASLQRVTRLCVLIALSPRLCEGQLLDQTGALSPLVDHEEDVADIY